MTSRLVIPSPFRIFIAALVAGTLAASLAFAQGPPPEPRLWSAVSAMDVLAKARACSADPGCTQPDAPPDLVVDVTTGQPLLSVHVKGATDITPLLDWAATTIGVEADGKQVQVFTETGFIVHLSMDLLDLSAWEGLVDALDVLAVDAFVSLHGVPVQAPGVHPELSAVHGALLACAGDIECMKGVGQDRPWLDPEPAIAAVQIDVPHGGSPGEHDAIVADLSSLSWSEPPVLFEITPMIGDEHLTRAHGRLTTEQLDGLQTWLDGQTFSAWTRPMTGDELSMVRLTLPVAEAAAEIAACGGDLSCHHGVSELYEIVVSPAGRLGIIFAGEDPDIEGLNGLEYPGWSMAPPGYMVDGATGLLSMESLRDVALDRWGLGEALSIKPDDNPDLLGLSLSDWLAAWTSGDVPLLYSGTPDLDGDGYDSVEHGGDDCDDGDPGIHPGAEEIFDCKDNDCDGMVPETETADADGDGWKACEDCDDGDPNINPGGDDGWVPGNCDGLDSDCDGLLGPDETDDDGDGYSECDGDADDTNPGTYGPPPVPQLWSTVAAMDVLSEARSCLADVGCAQPEAPEGLVVDPSTGQALLSVHSKGAMDIGPLLDWAAATPGVWIDSKLVHVFDMTGHEIDLSMDLLDLDAWEGLIDALDLIGEGAFASLHGIPHQADGVAPELAGAQDAILACAGDPYCLDLLRKDLPWLRPNEGRAGVRFEVPHDGQAGRHDAIAAQLESLDWVEPPVVFALDDAAGGHLVRVKGRITVAQLATLQGWLDGQDFTMWSRPLTEDEMSMVRLRLGVAEAAADVVACFGDLACQHSVGQLHSAVVSPAGRLGIIFQGENPDLGGLNGLEYPGWSMAPPGYMVDGATGLVSYDSLRDLGLDRWGLGEALSVKVDDNNQITGLTFEPWLSLWDPADQPSWWSPPGDDDDSAWGDDDDSAYHGGPPGGGPLTNMPRFWATVSTMDILGAVRTCSTDTTCTSISAPPGFEADPGTGHPLLSIHAKGTGDLGPLLAWADGRPEVTLDEKLVHVQDKTGFEVDVSMDLLDQGAWEGMVASLKAISSDAFVSIHAVAVQEPGVHADLQGTAAAFEGCAGDMECLWTLRDTDYWLDVNGGALALRLEVRHDGNPGTHDQIVGQVMALDWLDQPGVFDIEHTQTGQRFARFMGRLAIDGLGPLQSWIDAEGWAARSRPLTGDEMSAVRLKFDAVDAAADLLACDGQSECLYGVGQVHQAVVSPAGLLGVVLSGEAPDIEGLNGLEYPGWTIAPETYVADGAAGLVSWGSLRALGLDQWHLGETLVVDVDDNTDITDLSLGDWEDAWTDFGIPIDWDEPDWGDDDDIWIPDDDDFWGDDDDVWVPDDDDSAGGDLPEPVLPHAITVLHAERPLAAWRDPAMPSPHAWFGSTHLPDITSPGWGEDWGDFPGNPMWNPDMVNGFLGSDSTEPLPAAFPDILPGQPTRSILEDYYTCRDSAVPPDWCPPVDGGDDWYSLARGYEADPVEQTFSAIFDLPILYQANSVLIEEDTPVELTYTGTSPVTLLLSLTETTATLRTERWRRSVVFELALLIRTTATSGSVVATVDSGVLFSTPVDVLDGGAFHVPCEVEVTLDTGPMWLSEDRPLDPFGNPIPLADQLDVLVSCSPLETTGAIEVSDIDEPTVFTPGNGDWADAVEDVARAAPFSALEALNSVFASNLRQFLGPYLYAVNDVFGCPGIYSPCSVPSAPGTWPDGGTGSYWGFEDITLPVIQALMPAEGSLDALDAGVFDADWRDGGAVAAVLRVDEDSPVGLLDPALTGATTTAGYFGGFVLDQGFGDDLGTGVGEVVAVMHDLGQTAHPFNDHAAFLELVEGTLDGTVSRLPHLEDELWWPGVNCDDRFYEVFEQPTGLSVFTQCVEACEILGVSGLGASGPVLDQTAVLFGFSSADPQWVSAAPFLLGGLANHCGLGCADAVTDLRDQWMDNCATTSLLDTGELIELDDGDGGAVECYPTADADKDGRLDNDEHCTPDGCATGPFAWGIELEAVAPGEWIPHVQVYQAEFVAPNPPDDPTDIPNCRVEPILDANDEPLPLEIAGQPITWDADGEAIVDPDGDGFPNHLDPASGAGGGNCWASVIDGFDDAGNCYDDPARFTFSSDVVVLPTMLFVYAGYLISASGPSLFSYFDTLAQSRPLNWETPGIPNFNPGPPPPIPPILPPPELFAPWLIWNQDWNNGPQTEMELCVRFNLSDVTVDSMTLGDGAGQSAGIELGRGDVGFGDPAIDLDDFVPKLVVTDELVLNAVADLDFQVDIEVGPTGSFESCSGLPSDPSFDGDPEYEVTLNDLQITVPVTARWDFPLAEDRRWEWSRAWMQGNSFAIGFDDFVGALFQGNGLADAAAVSRVDFSLSAGEVSLSGPGRAELLEDCNPFDPLPTINCQMERICFGGVDDDFDGQTDCDDPDCAGAPACYMDFGGPFDPVAGYLLHVLLLPDETDIEAPPLPTPAELNPAATRVEDFVGLLISAAPGGSPLAGIEDQIADGLDMDGEGNIIAFSSPFFSSEDFWEAVRRDDIPLVSGVTHTQFLGPFLRAVPGMLAAIGNTSLVPPGFDPAAVIDSMSFDQIVGPQIRILGADMGYPGEVEGFGAVLSALDPAARLSAPREDLFDGLQGDIEAGAFTEGVLFPSLPESWLYAGFQPGNDPYGMQLPPLGSWNPASADWDPTLWSGDVYLGFYDATGWPESVDPNLEQYISEWRIEPLPPATPGNAGQP